MIYGDARSRHASAIVYCCATQRKQIGTLSGKHPGHNTRDGRLGADDSGTQRTTRGHRIIPPRGTHNHSGGIPPRGTQSSSGDTEGTVRGQTVRARPLGDATARGHTIIRTRPLGETARGHTIIRTRPLGEGTRPLGDTQLFGADRSNRSGTQTARGHKPLGDGDRPLGDTQSFGRPLGGPLGGHTIIQPLGPLGGHTIIQPLEAWGPEVT